MRLVAAFLCVITLGGPAAAQDAGTLADIRQDLATLSGEMQRLKGELVTTSGGGTQITGSTLDRINTIEAELQRITAKAEELQFRIEQVVQDGTNRIGDLEFRLCELEPGCDIASLGQTAPLGGGTGPAAPQSPIGSVVPQGTELAEAEASDFGRAQDALSEGNAVEAASLFATFRETYPGSPLDAAALLGEGRALEATGDIREAARRYLTAYGDYPDSDAAPAALWRLGAALGQLGSVPEACVTLAEVALRYPGDVAVAEAQDRMAALGCQ